ncbi:competence protein ComK [Aneurinibacillus terranovensis]|uniref:competence protein ComK n=1 Tax=Aneurinibacillus terranovensis TaxID=278991 RepID=UPI00040DF168|nr:competence protein ComK [Aneurinibacillus terranovensis]
MKELKLADGVYNFIFKGGHTFFPACMDGIGEVTRMYIGTEEFYATCSTSQFLKKISRELCMDLALVRRRSWDMLGQRKFPPLAFKEAFILIPFSFGVFSKAHRTCFIKYVSIKHYDAESPQSSSRIILKDSHTLKIPQHLRYVKSQLRQAENLRLRYKDWNGEL